MTLYMKTKKFTITAIGKHRLDILNRISALYLQKQIPVESIAFEETEKGKGKYQIVCCTSEEDSIKRIVNQICNIVDISKASYKI